MLSAAPFLTTVGTPLLPVATTFNTLTTFRGASVDVLMGPTTLPFARTGFAPTFAISTGSIGLTGTLYFGPEGSGGGFSYNRLFGEGVIGGFSFNTSLQTSFSFGIGYTPPAGLGRMMDYIGRIGYTVSPR